MRGADAASGSLFSYVDLEERVPVGHSLRKTRQFVNDALMRLDAELNALYSDFGWPSIVPERLIGASLLQILFSIRSERQLMEQMDYNLLFRLFVGLGIDEAVLVPTVFSKNRDRLLTAEMSRKVLAATRQLAALANLIWLFRHRVRGAIRPPQEFPKTIDWRANLRRPKPPQRPRAPRSTQVLL